MTQELQIRLQKTSGLKKLEIEENDSLDQVDKKLRAPTTAKSYY